MLQRRKSVSREINIGSEIKKLETLSAQQKFCNLVLYRILHITQRLHCLYKCLKLQSLVAKLQEKHMIFLGNRLFLLKVRHSSLIYTNVILNRKSFQHYNKLMYAQQTRKPEILMQRRHDLTPISTNPVNTNLTEYTLQLIVLCLQNCKGYAAVKCRDGCRLAESVAWVSNRVVASSCETDLIIKSFMNIETSFVYTVFFAQLLCEFQQDFKCCVKFISRFTNIL